jgi:hypothetical protein
MKETEFMKKLKTRRTKSASGEDFASPGSFATPYESRNTQQVSYCDTSVMLCCEMQAELYHKSGDGGFTAGSSKIGATRRRDV